ncbi:response regulator [Roseimaritima sediminicola]|uniref:response regulator n=1 Tax=Roseimaritima sediminicola TaxID=2662066 RepID=UPI00129856F9|nr:response regulator transcription factor [Roseimaritima sediminicola]
MTTKLLIVDDHEVVRLGLAALLEDDSLEVVGTAGNVEQAVQQCQLHCPDLVLLDVRLGGTDGLSAIAAFQLAVPAVRVVILSAYDNPTYIARAAALGAADYLLKSQPRETVLGALKRVAREEPLSQESLLRRIRAKMRRTEACLTTAELPLTNRELQVFRHVGLGLSNREIATSLGISVETVKEHVQNVLRKLEVIDRTEAAVRAVKMGVV